MDSSSSSSSSSSTHVRPAYQVIGAALAALSVALYVLPPTSGVASGAYIGQPHATHSWVLSAQQLVAQAGGVTGVAIMGTLNMPLATAVPFGALAMASGELTSLTVYALGGNSNATRLDATPVGVATLLVQPFVSQSLGRMGIVPILSLGALAAEGSGEGAAYGLVAASDAAGGLAAGSLAALAVAQLHIASPPRGSWEQLPLFVCVCAVAKLAAVPVILLVLHVRKRVMRMGRATA